ncbi:hypothetical protein [Kordiimonas laminariae]|uniref:hypothetical protein n=1 Tax=Kordiimonas laminariae TaxID=2917717 RepID=UPI001FF39E97|nr:hypothetical protein [Kordiimonas laminariae]MCK0068021.1 hypothetical protein [Kordiimonas laminariae]
MSRAEKLRRLFIGFCILGIGMGALYLWISTEAGKPYQTKEIGDIRLSVPRIYLPDGQQDLNEMVKEYLVSTAGRIQLSGYADEILSGTPLDKKNSASEIIWTIEPLGNAAHTDRVLNSDIMLFTGSGQHTKRTVTAEPQSGLFIYKANTEDDRNYSTSRLRPSATFTTDPAFSHCVDFRTVSLSGPAGRCSTHFVIDGMLIRAHYNRELAWHAAAIRQKLWQFAKEWQQAESTS